MFVRSLAMRSKTERLASDVFYTCATQSCRTSFTGVTDTKTDSIATNERCLMYNTFKSSLAMSPFFHDLKRTKLFAENKIRCFTTEVLRLRFARNAEADLACLFRNSEIESEIHFILSCTMT